MRALVNFRSWISEALSGGHWVTIKGQGGVTHLYLSHGGGGVAEGTVIAGPKGLIGANIAHLPAAPKYEHTHHSADVEPTGAKQSPTYSEGGVVTPLTKTTAVENFHKEHGKPANSPGVQAAIDALDGAKAYKGANSAAEKAAAAHKVAAAQHAQGKHGTAMAWEKVATGHDAEAKQAQDEHDKGAQDASPAGKAHAAFQSDLKVIQGVLDQGKFDEAISMCMLMINKHPGASKEDQDALADLRKEADTKGSGKTEAMPFGHTYGSISKNGYDAYLDAQSAYGKSSGEALEIGQKIITSLQAVGQASEADNWKEQLALDFPGWDSGGKLEDLGTKTGNTILDITDTVNSGLSYVEGQLAVPLLDGAVQGALATQKALQSLGENILADSFGTVADHLTHGDLPAAKALLDTLKQHANKVNVLLAKQAQNNMPAYRAPASPSTNMNVADQEAAQDRMRQSLSASNADGVLFEVAGEAAATLAAGVTANLSLKPGESSEKLDPATTWKTLDYTLNCLHRTKDGKQIRNAEAKAGIQAKLGRRFKAVGIDGRMATLIMQKLNLDDPGESHDPHERLASGIVSSWAGTSSDDSAASVAVQYTASKIFGKMSEDWTQQHTGLVDDRTWQQATSVTEDPVLGPVMEKAMREYYAETQEQFKQAGITHLTLFRGIKRMDLEGVYDASVKSAGGGLATTVRAGGMTQNPLTSWSANPHTADTFAGTVGTQNEQGKVNAVMACTVPVEEVFSHMRSGQGCLGEFEYVLIGHDRAVTAVTTKGITAAGRWNKLRDMMQDGWPNA